MPFFDGISIRDRWPSQWGQRAVALGFVLFVPKIVHWRRAHIQGLRRAQYIAAVGEIVARGLPHSFEPGWARDPLFHEVLLQYVDVVAGEERSHLEASSRRSISATASSSS